MFQKFINLHFLLKTRMYSKIMCVKKYNKMLLKQLENLLEKVFVFLYTLLAKFVSNVIKAAQTQKYF